MDRVSLKTPLHLFTAAAVGAALLTGVASPTPAKAETKLLFNLFVPAKHPFNTGLIQPWAKDVARVTENRVTVEFTTASLAPPTKQWNMVTSGIADVAMLNNVFERNRLQLPPIAELPFAGDNALQRSIAVWRTSEKFFAPADEYKGVKLLSLWAISGTNLYLTNKPVAQIDDLKRMKIWANGGMPKEMLSSLEAVVVTSPGVKIFDFVSKGIVEGMAGPAYLPGVFKLDRYIKYSTKVPGGLYSQAFSMFMNEKKWNALPERDRELIMSVSGEVAARNVGLQIDKLDEAAVKKAAEDGVVETVASPEFVSAMRDRFSFVTEAWLEAAKARGIDGPAAIEFFRSQL